MRRILRNSKGTVLIIVLGVLAVLALLATTFAVVSSVDRSVSNNYLDQIRAGRLARSGVAAAVAALSADPMDKNLRFWGNDEDEDGQADPGESSAGPVSIHDVPLDFAQNPSLALEVDGDPEAGLTAPRKINVLGTDGKPVTFGISGFHTSSTYAPESDVYQLRIKDMSGRLHLNDGAALFGGNQSSVSQNLRRILNVLGKLPTIRVPGLGDRVMANRPPGGFGSMLDLKSFLSAAERRRVEPFVTVHAWVDRNVANPVPLSSAVAGEYPVQYERSDPPVFRRGRGRSHTGGKIVGNLRWFDSHDTNKNHCAIYGLDELNPSYIEIVHRAPVNVNAASREVLIALLADLQGFFVSERRSFAPYAPSPKSVEQGGVTTPQRYHSWWTVSQTFDEREEDGDQYGFLYRTQAIRAPSADSASSTVMETASDGSVSAVEIADHIIACREKRSQGQTNYGTAWFGGPFRTWSQFNRFVDNLVETEVIRDRRPIYFDYVPTADWETLAPQPSQAGQKFASYAIGDVLKANFNPNLHLNELNPDANLYLRVDKTDLVVNSTEFTFMPTGIFEIESLGRVLRPASSKFTGDKAFYRIEAERRALVTVRAFEPYRETSQRHFQAGRFVEKDSNHPTNSGAALEMGPEPQAGPQIYSDHFGGYSAQATYSMDGYRGYAPGTLSQPTGWGFEFDGYIALSTYGGSNAPDPSGAKTTPACTPHWPVEHGATREGLHVHFQNGFDAGHNSGLDRRELASGSSDSNLKVANYSDAPGQPPGPLGPLTGKDGVHRLARSFRLPPRGYAPVAPNLPAFAPGDLRLDGFYSERNCGAAYMMKQRVSREGEGAVSVDQSGNFTFQGGVVSLWVKPSFFPEHTGKMRNIVSMSKYHEKQGYRNPSPFNLTFLPAHDMPAYQPSAADELGRWARVGGNYGDPADPPRPKGGPIAPKCEYRDPFSPMYDGNIGIASSRTPTELRGNLALGVWQFRPASFMAFRGATTADAGMASGGAEGGNLPDLVDIENYAVTSCLNHNLHEHGLDTGSTPNPRVKPADMRPNYFEAHRWTHVVLSWQVLPPW